MSSPTVALAAATEGAMIAGTTQTIACAVTAPYAVNPWTIAAAKAPKLRTMRTLGPVGSQIIIKSERQTSMDEKSYRIDWMLLAEWLRQHQEVERRNRISSNILAGVANVQANYAVGLTAPVTTWQPSAEDIIFLKVQRISAE